MKHVIVQAGYGRRRGEPPDTERRIVWDDAAGTVQGDHKLVPKLQERLAAPVTVIGAFWGSMEVREHARDPAQFLAVLYQYFGGLPPNDRIWPMRLPPELADVSPVQPPEPPPDPRGPVVY